MDPLITICARGGSQGVKEKNIRPLLGKPLIAHTIECALKWGKAHRVVVSTDSERIAHIAREHGAETPFRRPAELARGDVPKMAALRHALAELERDSQYRYEVIIDLDVTAPLRHVSDIEAAYQLLLSRRPLTVFSVVKARRNPYYNMVEADEEGYVHVSKDLGQAVTCRQQAPVVFDMNASIHVYSREYLVDEKNWHVCSDRSLPYVMDDLAAIDIDSELDFRYVEFLLGEGIFIP
jgi:CMP-N,N'-diacetyllegionaminic acid synthase